MNTGNVINTVITGNKITNSNTKCSVPVLLLSWRRRWCMYDCRSLRDTVALGLRLRDTVTLGLRLRDTVTLGLHGVRKLHLYTGSHCSPTAKETMSGVCTVVETVRQSAHGPGCTCWSCSPLLGNLTLRIRLSCGKALDRALTVWSIWCSASGLDGRMNTLEYSLLWRLSMDFFFNTMALSPEDRATLTNGQGALPILLQSTTATSPQSMHSNKFANLNLNDCWSSSCSAFKLEITMHCSMQSRADLFEHCVSTQHNLTNILSKNGLVKYL